MLKVVARYADVCNFSPWIGRPQDYQHKLDVLERYCRSVGRDPAEIRRSWASYVLIDEDPEEAEESIKRFVKMRAASSPLPPQRLRPPISGTPADCVKQIQRYVDLGISLFILRFMGSDAAEEVKIFAEKVAPVFARKCKSVKILKDTIETMGKNISS